MERLSSGGAENRTELDEFQKMPDHALLVGHEAVKSVVLMAGDDEPEKDPPNRRHEKPVRRPPHERPSYPRPGPIKPIQPPRPKTRLFWAKKVWPNT